MRLLIKTLRLSFLYLLALLYSTAIISTALAQHEHDVTSLIDRGKLSCVVVKAYSDDGNLLSRGSGFFVTDNRGNINVLTCYHVLKNASHAEIKTADGRIYRVEKKLSVDRKWDLLLASVDIPPDVLVQPLSISSVPPKVGNRIICIGNPLGYEWTVTSGCISAVRKSGNIVQTDAAISSGSSGSPLIYAEGKKSGEVVGIVKSHAKNGQNLNFAVSAGRIARFISGEADGIAGTALGRSVEVSYEAWFESSRRGNYEKALLISKYLVRRNSDEADAYRILGLTYGKLERYEEGLEALKKAIRINPYNPDLYACLAIFYIFLGRDDEVIKCYKLAIAADPYSVRMHSKLGRYYKFLGQYEEAVEVFRQVIRIEPDNATAYHALGDCYMRIGHNEAAIEHYKLAITIDPNNAAVHMNLGLVYSLIGRFEEAVKSYEQAVRINPNLAKVYIGVVIANGQKPTILDFWDLLSYQMSIDF